MNAVISLIVGLLLVTLLFAATVLLRDVECFAHPMFYLEGTRPECSSP